MAKEKPIFAALARIEAIAHYYGRIAGQSDEITEAFRGIAEEASEAIALTKESDGPDLLETLEWAVETLEWAVEAADADQYEQCWYASARAVITKVKGE
jgi:phage tail protein X